MGSPIQKKILVVFGEGACANRSKKARFLQICANTDYRKKMIVIFSYPHCWLSTVAIVRACVRLLNRIPLM